MGLALLMLCAGCAAGPQYGERHVWVDGHDPVDATYRHLNATDGTVGSPTGGNEGVNTWNAQKLYQNGTQVAAGGGNPAGSTGNLQKNAGSGAFGAYAGATCTNQALTALDASGAATCNTLTSSYVDNSIALTGTDVNTSNQVTATHLASALPSAQGGTANGFFTVSGPATSAKTFTFPNANSTVLTSNAAVTVAQGGTGTGSTLTGLMRGNASAMTAAELSGDATTSGSNAVTVTKINGSTKGTLFASGTLSVTDSATVGCVDQSTAVTNATTGMIVAVSPVGAPAGTGGGSVTWAGYATAGNITIRVCTIVVLTSAATTYNYEVFN